MNLVPIQPDSSEQLSTDSNQRMKLKNVCSAENLMAAELKFNRKRII